MTINIPNPIHTYTLQLPLLTINKQQLGVYWGKSSS